jgi:hypothetical protein
MKTLGILALVSSLAALTVGCSADSQGAPEDSTDAALSGERGFSDAQAQMDEIRGDLASNQAHLRGVLTPSQSRAYAAAFWHMDRVVTARTNHAKRANALAANLSRETKTLAAKKAEHGCLSPEKRAKVTDLYAAAKALSTGTVLGVGSAAPAHAVDDFHAYLAKDAGARECVNESMEGLEKHLGRNHAQMLMQVKLEQPEIDDLAAVKATFKTVAEVSPVARSVGTALEHFAGSQDMNALKSETGSSPTAMAAGTVLAVMHVGTLVDDVATRRYKKLVEDAVEGGAEDIAQISEAVTTLGSAFDTGRMESFLEKSEAFSKLAGKLAAGVGFVTSTLSLVSDIEGYRGDRLLYVARIAADSAALQASLVTFTELAALGPEAAAFVLLTDVVLEIATYWHAHVAAGRRNADTKVLLQKIGVPASAANILADANDEVLSALTEKGEGHLGLEPAQVQTLAAHAATMSRGAESFFTMADNTSWIAGAGELRRLFALSSTNTLGMLDATSKGTNGTAVRLAFDGCITSEPGVYASRANALAAIHHCSTRASAADERAALVRMGTFLSAH